MRVLAVIVTTLVLATAVPAHAQETGGGVGQAIGNILSNVLGRSSQIRGHVVLATGPGLIFRSDDSRTYRVDTSSLPAAEWRNLQPGDAVTVVGRRAESGGDTLVAERIQADASAPRATYRTAQGTIESVSGSQATMRTNDGRTLTLDLSALPTTARPAANQPATVVYEGGGGTSPVTALWAEAGGATSTTTQPSASVPTTTQSGYQRLHGFVESIGVSTLTLKTDSGQTLAVDTSGIPQQQMASTRPGDVVSVTGQMTGNTFKASVLRKD